MHCLKSLKEGEELTGGIVSEVGRRTTASALHVAFLDSAFLEKAAPIERESSKYRRQYWTLNIGKGVDSPIGTARTTFITLHCAPGHW